VRFGCHTNAHRRVYLIGHMDELGHKTFEVLRLFAISDCDGIEKWWVKSPAITDRYGLIEFQRPARWALKGMRQAGRVPEVAGRGTLRKATGGPGS